jgi:hypothetical protein
MKEKPITINLEQYGDYAALTCPVCGHANVAPTQVNVIGGIGETDGIGTRVDASGTAIYATPTFGRGVQIELTFSCECQHSFVYELRFHKGQTHLRLREYPFFENGSVIWRD